MANARGEIFYTTADNPRPPLALSERPQPVHARMEQVYLPSAALTRAVNVALLLGMPLLLTGKPGVGKTRLAQHLATCHRAPFEVYTVTSQSTARDLLYGFDDLRRMRDAFASRHQTQTTDANVDGERTKEARAKDDLDYVTFRALGRAILRAGGEEAPVIDLSTGSPAQTGAPYNRFSDLFDATLDRERVSIDRRRAGEEALDWKQPTVVLIDEIDKAPRDLPNDLLTELDKLQFDIPELGVRVSLPPQKPRPVIVITSNDEHSLPEAFLRRCVFHHIDWPEPDDLAAIIQAHISALKRDSSLTQQALALVVFLRNHARIEKQPGIAEMMQWLHLLHDHYQIDNLRVADAAQVSASLSVLFKSKQDMEAGMEVMQAWRDKTL